MITEIRPQAERETFFLRIGQTNYDRREHRRHDLESRNLPVQRWDAHRGSGVALGTIVDISAGGVRLRTSDNRLRVDQQIRVRLELPAYAGICPFVDTRSDQPQPKRDWVGWMTITRVRKIDGKTVEAAGRLVDMDELDRGMLGLYLSTQPMAA
jgi:hypothetical protein